MAPKSYMRTWLIALCVVTLSSIASSQDVALLSCPTAGESEEYVALTTYETGQVMSDEDGSGTTFPYAANASCSWLLSCPSNTMLFIRSIQIDLAEGDSLRVQPPYYLNYPNPPEYVSFYGSENQGVYWQYYDQNPIPISLDAPTGGAGGFTLSYQCTDYCQFTYSTNDQGGTVMSDTDGAGPGRFFNLGGCGSVIVTCPVNTNVVITSIEVALTDGGAGGGILALRIIPYLPVDNPYAYYQEQYYYAPMNDYTPIPYLTNTLYVQNEYYTGPAHEASGGFTLTYECMANCDVDTNTGGTGVTFGGDLSSSGDTCGPTKHQVTSSIDATANQVCVFQLPITECADTMVVSLDTVPNYQPNWMVQIKQNDDAYTSRWYPSNLQDGSTPSSITGTYDYYFNPADGGFASVTLYVAQYSSVTFTFSYYCTPVARCSADSSTGQLLTALHGTMINGDDGAGDIAQTVDQDCGWQIQCPVGFVVKFSAFVVDFQYTWPRRINNVLQVTQDYEEGGSIATNYFYQTDTSLQFDSRIVEVSYKTNTSGSVFGTGMTIDYECVDTAGTCAFSPPPATPEPSPLPSFEPSQKPTPEPTPVPTLVPTAVPTHVPTLRPTPVPTRKPTRVPTPVPTKSPTPVPTLKPTRVPTIQPTPLPTVAPTLLPTVKPTVALTAKPTRVPTPIPTKKPTPIPTPRPPQP